MAVRRGNLADNDDVLGGMLPEVDALFTLIGQLARRSPVTEIAAPKWLVHRHSLGPLAARSGVAGYRDILIQATLDWARVEQDLPPLVTALREAKVRVAPIKGVAYATSLYAAPAERPMADVDLLVPVAALDAARAVLARCGFTEAHPRLSHHATGWIRGDLMVDLHWSIIGHGRSRIDLDAVWARTSPGWPHGSERLDWTDSLVFHLVHFTRNRLRSPLVNVVDYARLLEHTSVEAALQRAREWRLRTAAELSIRFCESVLANSSGRPAGWLGPSRDDTALLTDSTLARKVLFDVATAGSPRQLASRIVHFGANTLRTMLNNR